MGKFRKGIGMMAKDRSGFVVAYGPSENVPTALAEAFAKLEAEGDLDVSTREALRVVWPSITANSTPSIHFAKETRALFVRSRLTLRWQPGTSWNGREWDRWQRTGNGSTMPAIWL